MKRLLLILILTLSIQTLVKADDIRDFEIEGMSIGDSLLDFFSEDEIVNAKTNWFKDKSYSVSNNLKTNNFQTYEIIQAAYKTIDKRYILEGIEGYQFFSKNKINECFKIQDDIISTFNDLFTNVKIGKKKTFDHPDPNNHSIVTNVSFTFDNGNKVMVGCVERKDKTSDLRVILRTKEYSYFLNFKAYK
jgi:hypothetical protein